MQILHGNCYSQAHRAFLTHLGTICRGKRSRNKILCCAFKDLLFVQFIPVKNKIDLCKINSWKCVTQQTGTTNKEKLHFHFFRKCDCSLNGQLWLPVFLFFKWLRKSILVNLFAMASWWLCPGRLQVSGSYIGPLIVFVQVLNPKWC